ncbi:PTS sorbitol transporter subunit IIB, partial [Anaerosalibacter bizertensis]|nr:PTS sorbitol transporter subunit IIB [Anaerosalibacter bizertensis]
MEYTAVKIEKGPGGWGGPLILKPKPGKDKILSVTGGGISPVAKKIAELTGATIVDAFKTVVPDDEILAAVIDCGGTARCGVYPKKKILTVNLTPVGQSGPLAKFITEELYVSGVTEKNIIVLDKLEVEDEETHVNILEEKTRSKSISQEKENIVGK